jgi:hypothetical protein
MIISLLLSEVQELNIIEIILAIVLVDITVEDGKLLRLVIVGIWSAFAHQKYLN